MRNQEDLHLDRGLPGRRFPEYDARSHIADRGQAEMCVDIQLLRQFSGSQSSRR